MGLPCENLSLRKLSHVSTCHIIPDHSFANTEKALGAKPSYWSNVAPKINFKLGGVNQTIEGDPPGFKQVPTIVFGAEYVYLFLVFGSRD